VYAQRDRKGRVKKKAPELARSKTGQSEVLLFDKPKVRLRRIGVTLTTRQV